jgi:hypothetical protein
VPWISRVSPSMMLAWLIRSVNKAEAVETRRNMAAIRIIGLGPLTELVAPAERTAGSPFVIYLMFADAGSAIVVEEAPWRHRLCHAYPPFQPKFG